ncbi:MAG TPA: sigma-70 family RNA polymerase sigma factor, partial [Planctomycetota bacterium]|nr:sigma-70 family RNA polymerase sigma factor [Planctomycetota bacterium]
MSVEQLFQRYRTTGDPQALGQVFDQVAAQLLSLALHLCQNIADAEDALQATFLVAIAKAQQFEHGRALLPWLTGILTLHCRKSFERRARRREQELTDDAAPVASAPLPPAVAEQQELVAQLRSHVEALPDEQRQVLLLQLQHGLQPAEIAEVLGVPSGTVRVRLHRGLRALRRLLPSGLAAWLFAALPARGTAAVRQEIVAAAQRALPVGAAATSLVWLPFLAMKKLAAVVIVALAAGTWMLLQNSDPLVEQAARAGTGSSMRAEQVAAATPPIELRDVADAPAMQRQQLAFSVLVVDENERPLVDATVRCWQEDHEPTLQRTGADGRAEFAAVERAGGLLVQAPACMQVLQALPHLVGEHRVVLGAGKRVAGQMLVDGKPAPAGLQLAISGKPFESQAPLPPSIAELLRDWQPHSTTATDAAGHFAFRGLADDWQGSLDLPRTHWLLPIAGRDFDNNDYDDLWFLPLAVPCE